MSLIIGHTVYNTGNNETSYPWQSAELTRVCCESAIHVCCITAPLRDLQTLLGQKRVGWVFSGRVPYGP